MVHSYNSSYHNCIAHLRTDIHTYCYLTSKVDILYRHYSSNQSNNRYYSMPHRMLHSLDLSGSTLRYKSHPEYNLHKSHLETDILHCRTQLCKLLRARDLLESILLHSSHNLPSPIHRCRYYILPISYLHRIYHHPAAPLCSLSYACSRECSLMSISPALDSNRLEHRNYIIQSCILYHRYSFLSEFKLHHISRKLLYRTLHSYLLRFELSKA
jgi:hypothetical protein